MRSQNGTLNVRITNIKEIKGELVIAIYDKKENYPKEGLEYKKLILKVDDSIVVYTFEDLPQKEYAIAVFHDENSDGKCNGNLLGIPTEGYGFSNNIKPIFSAPPFKKVKFKLNNLKSVIIKLFNRKKWEY